MSFLAWLCVNILGMRRYRIGEVAELLHLTVRTIRYYEEEGLIKISRTSHRQRWYTDEDILYLRRIIELKSLGFSIDEIRGIIRLKDEDESGNKRRLELIRRYRAKLSDDMERKRKLEEHISELEWHIHQLEGAEGRFQSCPGESCRNCDFKDRCSFHLDFSETDETMV